MNTADGYQFGAAYKNKTVFVTGHTGFKGSWLSQWLLLLGARVVGYALDPPTTPSHFSALGIGDDIAADLRADVRSLGDLQASLDEHQPDFIFHLAAQPIVTLSYDEPVDTFHTNCAGTLNVLEAVRRARRPCIVIIITTDKVYENVEWAHAYRENDVLGGHDPYSASKSCAELMIASYRHSYFSGWLTSSPHPAPPAIAVASARGGNVIGGGDWADNRIVPDCVKNLAGNRAIPVRNKSATRPWQHVLELLSGYLHLGAEMARALDARQHERLQELCAAFNFGPHITSNKSVGELVREVLKHWPGQFEDLTQPNAQHEAGRLNLTIDKAYHTLNWQPQWNFEQTIRHTVDWYREYYQTGQPNPAAVKALTQNQILTYAAELNYAER